ncbi:MAG: GAF domain-containing protein [Anaerolineae bacterium]|nr:GAF domain-containing protein [Anaerolineae bacterium]
MTPSSGGMAERRGRRRYTSPDTPPHAMGARQVRLSGSPLPREFAPDTVSDAPDEEARRTALLNTFSTIGIFVASFLVILAEIGRQRGYFGSPRQAHLTTLFPIVFIALSVVVLLLCRRGRRQDTPLPRLIARLYVWSTALIVVAAAALFNGYRSATWLVVLWPIVLAGGLLQPRASLGVGLGAFAVYVVVIVLELAGLYTPPMPTSADSFPFFALSFGWLMAIMVVALVDTIKGRSLHRALTVLRTTSEDLELARQDLTQRVEDRTARLQDRAEQLRVIAELGQVAASIQDLETLLPRAAALISERLGFYHVGIFLLDPTRQWAVLRAASSQGGAKMLARDHRLRVGQQGIVGYVAEMGTPRFAFNVGADGVWFSNPDLPATKSEIALPLTVAERVIGVLDIQTLTPSAFTEDDIGTLRILADSIAVAIHNAQLLQETRQTLARLERYQEEDAVRAWRQALSRRRMQIGYAYSDGAVAASPQNAELSKHLGRVQTVTRQTTDDGRHVLLAPIHVSGAQLGILSFESASAWSDEAVQLVETVVGQLDLALTNARLLEETRLRAAHEAARGEIVGRLRALTSTDAILRNAAEEVGRALQVERSRIQLVHGGKHHRLGDE